MYKFGDHEFNDDDPIIELIELDKQQKIPIAFTQAFIDNLVDYRNAGAPYENDHEGFKNGFERWVLEKIRKQELISNQEK